MILTSERAEKLFNSDYIKKIYPMIDKIGDEDFPFYKLYLTVKLNDPTITSDNMYDKEFDPHYLYEGNLKYLLQFLNINRNTATIEQVYIKTLGPDGEEIHYY
jgi:predicted nucleic acid-binding protein